MDCSFSLELGFIAFANGSYPFSHLCIMDKCKRCKNSENKKIKPIAGNIISSAIGQLESVKARDSQSFAVLADLLFNSGCNWFWRCKALLPSRDVYRG